MNANFKAVKQNHNSKYTKVANHIMDGKFDWFCKDIYDDVPPGYKKYMNKSMRTRPARRPRALFRRRKSWLPNNPPKTSPHARGGPEALARPAFLFGICPAQIHDIYESGARIHS